MGKLNNLLPNPSELMQKIRSLPGGVREWYHQAVIGMLKGRNPAMFAKTLIILYLALVLVPFILLPNHGIREQKMGFAMFFSLGIALLAIYYGKLKPFRNYWALCFVGYLLLNYHFAPKPVDLIEQNIPNLWSWKPILKIVIFLMLWVSISSLKFSNKDRNQILSCMVWVGTIMAMYVLSQWNRIDQFCSVFGSLGGNESVNFVGTGGTLGNRTLVSPFMAMLVPLAIYLRKWWKAGLMILAVLATRSQVAIGALLVSLTFLYCSRYRRVFYLLLAGVALVFTLSVIGYNTNDRVHDLIDDGSRFKVWGMVVDDWQSPVVENQDRGYALTGQGIGSFRYAFSFKHRNDITGPMFHQAHNEYLQVLYECGLIGLLLMLAAILQVFRDIAPFDKVWRDPEQKHRIFLLSSFLVVVIAALGTFIWQMAPLILYTLTVLGLLQNSSNYPDTTSPKA